MGASLLFAVIEMSLLSIAILSLLFLGIQLLFYRYVRRCKDYSKRMKQIFEVQQEKEKLLLKKTETLELEVKALVADNNMRLLFKKLLLEQLKEDSCCQPEEIQSYAKQLMIRIQLQIGTERRLTSLQKKRSEVNLGFHSKIIRLYPNMTKTEREVCSLLRLNLSIKEVASIRNATIGSIKIIRHRIRRKLDVPSGEELEHFVQNL